MGGRHSKQKGYRNENQLVHLFRDAGVSAERCPLSGAAAGRYRGFDLIVNMFDCELKIETKHHGNGFATLYKLLEPETVDMLVVRRDHSEPLVVIPLSTFIALHNSPEESK